jgi:hypothetical protein
VCASFFLNWFRLFSKSVTFSKDLYFSSFCSLADNKEEFLSNYTSNKSKKTLHNQTLLGRYFVNTDELMRLKNNFGKSL